MLKIVRIPKDNEFSIILTSQRIEIKIFLKKKNTYNSFKHNIHMHG
jgi:hypothetical protein